MFSIRAKIRDAEASRKFRSIWSKLKQALQKEMGRQSALMTNFIKMRHLRGGTTEDRLRVRTGHLRRTTVPAKTKIKRGKIEGGTLFRAIYAGVHVGRKGKRTVIKPRRAKFLTIPMRGAMTPAGVTRGPARSFENTFIRRTKTGHLIIFQRKQKKIIPLFLLVRQVEIPTRVHPEAIAKEIGNKVKRAFQKTVRKVIEAT